MSSRYLDPKVDLAFKRVFGEHEHLLRSFLNALLPLPEDAPIESLEYLTPEQVPEVPGLFKNSIVDVKCRDTQGRTFIVEMQMLWSASFSQRILFSASQAYVKQLRAGQSYDGLQPVYALAITNKVFDKTSDQYYHHYQIVNTQNPQRVLPGLEFVFIEIPKFKPQTANQISTAKRMQVKWLRFLSEVGVSDANLGDLEQDADIQDALKLVEVASYSDMEIEAYHITQDRARLEPTIMADMKNEGRAEGEATAQARIVNNMVKIGMTPEQISHATGVTIQMVQRMLGH